MSMVLMSLPFARVLAAAPACPSSGEFFGLVHWYAYFPPTDFSLDASGNCNVDIGAVHNAYNSDGSTTSTICATQNSTCTGSGINSIWLIALAIFEDLLRVAGVVTIAFVIYGGIRFTLSQGEPENTRAARSTIINALIGMAIALIAAASVSFIGHQLGG